MYSVKDYSKHLQKLIGEQQFHFNVNKSSQLQNLRVPVWWNLLRHTLQRLWVVEKVSGARKKVWEGKLWKNSNVVVVSRGESLQQFLSNKPVGHIATFSEIFSGNFGGKLPVIDDILLSHEEEIYPTISLDENCREFDFQTNLKYYVDL